MTPLRAVVVDDEVLARQRLERALPPLGVEVAGVATDGRSAIERIAALRPDVVFLDIRMPDLDGVDVLTALDRSRPPVVVFVTAFARFAPNAFDAQATDFLLKPFSAERLAAAVARARAALRDKAAAERVEELERVLKALREDEPDADRPRFDTDLWASSREGSARIPVADIAWLEAERDYVRIHAGGRSYMRREALHRLEQRLDPEAFVRIHRSAVVRVAMIAQVRRGLGRSVRVELRSGDVLEVSRSCAPAIRALARGLAP